MGSRSDYWTQALKNINTLMLVLIVFSPGFTSRKDPIPAHISYIKKAHICREQVYLLKAWVKEIDPPINSKCLQLNTSVM
jgi:hypothetical protein